jgi:hypothetical protein
MGGFDRTFPWKIQGKPWVLTVVLGDLASKHDGKWGFHPRNLGLINQKW